MNGLDQTLEFQRILGSLYPEAISCVFSNSLPASAQHPAQEIELTAGMAEKRKREFLHGRYCARAALQGVGAPDQPIGRGVTREPLWPEGYCGSISHTGHFAAAVAAPLGVASGLGLDMESDEPLEDRLIDSICRSEELARIPAGQSSGQHAKLLFSIKESIYKCLWPRVGEFIDFTEMEVRTDMGSGSYNASAHTDKCDPDLVSRLRGRYIQHGGLIVASAVIA